MSTPGGEFIPDSVPNPDGTPMENDAETLFFEDFMSDMIVATETKTNEQFTDIRRQLTDFKKHCSEPNEQGWHSIHRLAYGTTERTAWIHGDGKRTYVALCREDRDVMTDEEYVHFAEYVIDNRKNSVGFQEGKSRNDAGVWSSENLYNAAYIVVQQGAARIIRGRGCSSQTLFSPDMFVTTKAEDPADLLDANEGLGRTLANLSAALSQLSSKSSYLEDTIGRYS